MVAFSIVVFVLLGIVMALIRRQRKIRFRQIQISHDLTKNQELQISSPPVTIARRQQDLSQISPLNPKTADLQENAIIDSPEQSERAFK